MGQRKFLPIFIFKNIISISLVNKIILRVLQKKKKDYIKKFFN